MTDLQCPAVLILTEDPEAALSGTDVGPGAEQLRLPGATTADDDALLTEAADLHRGETLVVTGPAPQLRLLLGRHSCAQTLPARVEAGAEGWRRVDPQSAERHVALTAQKMTGLQMHGILHLRESVFVMEQGIVVEEEIEAADALDTTIHHWLELDGRPVAVLRLLTGGDAVVVGRVATAREHRGRGLAARLIRQALEQIAEDDRPVRLHAQAHLEHWYERLGFRRDGDDFPEAGIPHTPMLLRR